SGRGRLPHQLQNCGPAARQAGLRGGHRLQRRGGPGKVGATPTRCDLMLLDIVMPGLDGIEVLSKVKGTAHLQHLPICMLSGLEDQTLAEVCLQQGALEVLLKPLKVDAVQRVVDLHCERRPQPAA
ncbi:unnamed protein product, partial [Heterosigma akashiwo]